MPRETVSIPTEASTSTLWTERECAAVVVVFLFVGFQSFHLHIHCLNLAQGNKSPSVCHLFSACFRFTTMFLYLCMCVCSLFNDKEDFSGEKLTTNRYLMCTERLGMCVAAFFLFRAPGRQHRGSRKDGH